MDNRERRARGPDWNHAQTMALAELKREASLNEEQGRLVWERIAQTLSSRFPGQTRTGAQCRRRWDTLVKVYNRIEDFCVQTGQDHWELDEGELASMELATAYYQDWYDIVEQVCSQVSQRKRKERCDDDPMPGKRSESFHSVELPERPPDRDSLCSASTSKSVTHHEQSIPESTTTYAQVFGSPSLKADKLIPEEEVQNGNAGVMLEQSATALAQVSDSSPSLEADKLSPEEEAPRLKHGNEQSTTAHAQVSSSPIPIFVLEATQVRQHGQVSHEVSQEPQTLESANLLPHTLAAENAAQLEELLQPLAAEYGAQFEEPLQTLAAENAAQLEEPLQTLAAEYGAQFEEPLQTLAAENAAQLEEPLQTLAAENGAQLEERLQLINFFTREDLSLRWIQIPHRRQIPQLHFETSTIDMEIVVLEDWLEDPEDEEWDPARDSFLWTFTAEGHSTRTNDDDSTIPRKSQVRWWFKIVFVFRPCRLACDSKEKARKNALMSRKENVPTISSAANSTSPTSATRGDKRVQKSQKERASKQVAFDKREETMPRKAETEAANELQEMRACGQIVRKVEQKTQISGLSWPILTVG